MRANLFGLAVCVLAVCMLGSVLGCSNEADRVVSGTPDASTSGAPAAPDTSEAGADGAGGAVATPGDAAAPTSPDSGGSLPHSMDASPLDAGLGGDGGARDSADSGSGVGAVDGSAVTLDASSSDENAPIVPRGITILPLTGGNGVLEVTALTLKQGPAGPEVYVALENTGDQHACSAAVSMELYDWNELSLASGIGGLLTQNYYRVLDGSDAIAACIGPGEVSVAAITDLPTDLVIEDVGFIVYRCPYFALGVEGPLAGLRVNDVVAVPRGGGVVYSGEVVNGFDFAVGSPSVSVYPINRVGRPLGVATSTGTADISPGGSWAFETDLVGAAGFDTLSFVAGAFDN